jgi:RNA polymerase sigma factor (sigma-70 family)
MTMGEGGTGSAEHVLLERAQRGEESAYRDLVEIHRAELHAHCYRMLASVQDAEDAVQEALLRAWRGLSHFEGRSSVRTWLFKIATNTALDTAERRSRRELPIGHGPAAAGFITDELVQRSAQSDDRFVGTDVFPRFGLPAELGA